MPERPVSTPHSPWHLTGTFHEYTFSSDRFMRPKIAANARRSDFGRSRMTGAPDRKEIPMTTPTDRGKLGDLLHRKPRTPAVIEADIRKTWATITPGQATESQAARVQKLNRELTEAVNAAAYGAVSGTRSNDPNTDALTSGHTPTVRAHDCPQCRGKGVITLTRAAAKVARSTAVRSTPPQPRAESTYRALMSGALDPERVVRLSRKAKMDLALKVVEHELSRSLTPSQVDHIDGLLRSPWTQDFNGGIFALRVATYGTDVWFRTWLKLMSGTGVAYAPDELAAMALRAETMRSLGEFDTGAFGLPIAIDPTIISLGTLDDSSILSVCKVVPTTSNLWKGVVATGGGGFQLKGENGVIGDGSPVFSQPVVKVFALTDFVPFSYEIGSDFPGWFQTEAPRMFAANYADRISLDTSVGGDGVTAPEGLFSGLVGVTSSTVRVGTSGALSAVDVRAAWAALPPRMKNDPSCCWHMHNTTWDRIQGLGLGNDVQSFESGDQRLMAKKVILSSYDPPLPTTSGTASYLVCGAMSRYAVVQHTSGVSAELIPQLRDPSSGMPNGERGLLAVVRHGSAVLDPASFVILTN
jgi:HK97 family phage major capsid protein